MRNQTSGSLGKCAEGGDSGTSEVCGETRLCAILKEDCWVSEDHILVALRAISAVISAVTPCAFCSEP